MTCPGENTLLDFLGGATDPDAHGVLDEHLAQCAACRSLLEEARGELSRTLSEEETLDPNGTVNQRARGTPSDMPLKDPLIGERIGDYEVLERIGSGGMGVVYRGVQPIIGKPVAIKVIRAAVSEDDQLIQRMLLEARSVNAIGHRGIVDIFGFGQLPNGRHYVVMEYLQGAPLDVWLLEQEPPPLEELLALLDEILLPLGAAHSAGVVHRDLKPSNLFVVMHSDGARHIKLLDFGLAKRTVHDQGLTRPGLVLGTPAYMAPEQVLGLEVDARSDLYSFAVLAYKIATAERPFPDNDALGQMQAHVSGKPRPIRELRPDLPESLEKLLLELLEKDPAARPASVKEVRRQLKALRPPDVLTSPSTPAYPLAAPPSTPLPTLNAKSDTVPDMPAIEASGALSRSTVSDVAAPRRSGRAKALLAVTGISLAVATGIATLVIFAVRVAPEPVAATGNAPDPRAVAGSNEQVFTDLAQLPGLAPEAEPVAKVPEAALVRETPQPEPPTAVKTAKATRSATSVSRTSPRPTLDDSRRSLLSRIRKLRSRMKAKSAGGEPDVLSTMFLDKAEADAKKARSAAELRAAERTIQGVERRFLMSER